MLASLAGVCAALLAFELCLRPFMHDLVDEKTRVREVRYMREGIATSHFAEDGWRMTGSAPAEGGPVGLIFGDSHVEALQVDDRSTMGAVAERLARERGDPLTVRQYGWSGAAPPYYLAESERLLREWSPAWVAVVLSAEDLVPDTFGTARRWRMRVADDLTVTLVDTSEPPPPRPAWLLALERRGLAPREARKSLLRRSALAAAVKLRYDEIGRPKWTAEYVERFVRQRASDETARITLATVRALKRAFGPRLFLVYLPLPAVMAAAPDDPAEDALERACRDEHVELISARVPMREALEREGRMSFGFPNTRPNFGHLNEVGHGIVGELIWRAASTRGAAARAS